MLNTPVLFLIFNRPDTTRSVFEVIRQAKPKQLFIAADGPRIGRETDIQKCEQAHEIIEDVDWDCEVRTLFRETNLGCKYAVSSAITWFFEQVEEGIILEDDTLPNLSFFKFCDELLAYYRDTMQVMHIGGVNFQNRKIRGNASYYFSVYNHIWGWATWRRAWKCYDPELVAMEKAIQENNFINKIISSAKERKYWSKVFNDSKKGDLDTWDYQWLFSIWMNNGVCIIPKFNLVSNIGFGQDSTHTTTNSKFANLALQYIGNIVHQKNIEVNIKADKYTFNTHFCPPTNILNRIRNFSYKYISKYYLDRIKNLFRILVPNKLR